MNEHDLCYALEHDRSKYEKELRDFFAYGLMKVREIQLADIKLFKDMSKYCLYIWRLYLSFYNYENLVECAPAIMHLDTLACEIDKKAAEPVGYWMAKKEQKLSNMKGGHAPKKNRCSKGFKR